MMTTTAAVRGDDLAGDQNVKIAAHAPGPWTLRFSEVGPWESTPRPERIVDALGQGVYAACIGITADKSGEGLANARLIAAAPDMLTALKAMCLNMENDGHEYRDCYKAALRAIARATGAAP